MDVITPSMYDGENQMAQRHLLAHCQGHISSPCERANSSGCLSLPFLPYKFMCFPNLSQISEITEHLHDQKMSRKEEDPLNLMLFDFIDKQFSKWRKKLLMPNINTCFLLKIRKLYLENNLLIKQNDVWGPERV
jgi:hypothetical protein